MPEIIYFLCAVMSVLCAVLLLRGYFRSRTPLLLWSGLCFAVFALNAGFLAVDMIFFPTTDLGGPVWRNLFAATSGSLLLFGLVWEIT